MIRLDRSSWTEGGWGGITLAIVLALATGARAQAPKPADSPATKTQAAPPAGADAPAAPDGGEAATAASVGLSPADTGANTLEERFNDPKAAPLLENTFPELFANIRVAASSDAQIEAMANGSQPTNAPVLAQYIQAQVAQLTSHRNIAAVADAAAQQTRYVKEYDLAGQRLVRPLAVANERNNPAFRTAFSEALAAVAPEVLSNHLYARLALMVALSRSGDPVLIPLLAKVLRDESQPLAVKMLASVGVGRIAGNGTIDVEPARAIEASAAVADFLRTDQPPFWPVQFRAIQAIGAMKQAASNPVNADPDLAAVVLGYLANPEVAPQVRAWAGWSLGLLRPSVQASQFNFQLIVYHVGRAVAAIGHQIAESDAKNPEQTSRLAGLLLEMIIGLDGDASMRNSGLLRVTHPALAAQRRAIDTIVEPIRNVARKAIDLTLAPGNLRPPARQELAAAVAELAAVLEKTAPQEMTLYPGSPEFTPQAPILPPAGSGDALDARVNQAVERARAARESEKSAAPKAP